MTCVARRVSDGKMLHLIKMWLKAPVEETDERGHRRMSGGQEGNTRNTAGRGGFATLGEHLYASVHQGVSQVRSGPPVRRGAGDLR